MTNSISSRTFNALKKGDSEAFRITMQENYSRIYVFIERMVKSKMDAEELTQDVFLKLWQNRHELKSHKTFYGILYAIARNTTFDFMRKKGIKTVDIDNITIIQEMVPDVESVFAVEELDILISMEITKFPPQRRLIYELAKKDGLSRLQIAEKLQISPKTVSNQMSAALDQLKKTILTLAILLSEV